MKALACLKTFALAIPFEHPFQDKLGLQVSTWSHCLCSILTSLSPKLSTARPKVTDSKETGPV